MNTNEQVQAAARAIYEHEPYEDRVSEEIPWDALGQGTRDRYTHKARAALEAALAAATPADPALDPATVEACAKVAENWNGIGMACFVISHQIRALASGKTK